MFSLDGLDPLVQVSHDDFLFIHDLLPLCLCRVQSFNFPIVTVQLEEHEVEGALAQIIQHNLVFVGLEGKERGTQTQTNTLCPFAHLS